MRTEAAGHDEFVTRATRADLPALAQAMADPLYFANRVMRQEARSGALFVAWRNGVPVGDVYLRMTPPDEPELRYSMPDVALLTHLEVAEEYRKQGIGTALMEMVERHAWERGFDRIALGVTDTNTNAIRLYEVRGYQQGEPSVIETYREIYHEDGSVTTEPDGQCLVYVRALTAPPDASRGRRLIRFVRWCVRRLGGYRRARSPSSPTTSALR